MLYSAPRSPFNNPTFSHRIQLMFPLLLRNKQYYFPTQHLMFGFPNPEAVFTARYELNL